MYVGETGRELRERIEEHLRDIRLNKDNAVATNFTSEGHSINNLKVTQLKKSPWTIKVITTHPRERMD